MALGFRLCGLILPVAVSAVVLARPLAAPEVQASDKSIYVTVVDDAGKPVTGLAPTDFGVREDNVIREVTGVKAATEPLSVVLLADTTGSVGENVRDIRTSATTFVREVLGASPESQIQLSEFQGASTVRVKFTPKLPDLEKAIARLFPQPDTASVLFEALVDASKDLGKRPSPRRAIVSINMEPTGEQSTLQPKDVASEVMKSGASLWAISIQTGTNRNMARDQVLSGLAVNTGGMRQGIITASGLETWMKVFASCLTSQYVVTYKRPDATPAKIVQVALRQGLGHKALASFAAPK
jgi:VWFA-related protein